MVLNVLDSTQDSPVVPGLWSEIYNLRNCRLERWERGPVSERKSSTGDPHVRSSERTVSSVLKR